MDVNKLFELRENFLSLYESYVAKLHEAGNPNIPFEEMMRLCRESIPIKNQVDTAEYEYKRFIATIEPKELEALDDETLKKVMPILLFDGADFQQRIFLEIFDKRIKNK